VTTDEVPRDQPPQQQKTSISGHAHVGAQTTIAQAQIVNIYAETSATPFEEELRRARLLLDRLPLDTIPDPAPLSRRSPKMPARSSLFVGREEDLRTLARALKGGKTTAIGQVAVASGLGGIGKTQLASEFVHRYGQFFEGGVFWLSFADSAVVPTEIAACGEAGSLNLRPDFGGLSLAAQVRLVQATWDEPIPRLLVFDNCEDPAVLRTWRPATGGCRVLVTSRNSRWDTDLDVHQIALDTLPRDKSVALLSAFPRVPARDPALAQIAAELGDLPLALHLAGSYLSTYAGEVSPARYLEQLRKGPLQHPSLQPSETQATASPTDHDQHVSRTFEISFARLDPTKHRASANDL
jgi:hypothetical protein